MKQALRWFVLAVLVAVLGACGGGAGPDGFNGALADATAPLQNGVPVTNLSGARSSLTYFSLNVPSGASNLQFTMSGGSGDADLYVKFGSTPTTSSYDCRPFKNGNAESCSFSAPQAGTYYVMIRGYSNYSGVQLVGSYTGGSGGGGTQLQKGTPVTGLSGATGSQKTFTLAVPSGASNLSIKTSGGSGDADLYVKFGSAPTTSSYDCRPYLNGNTETCNFSTPQAGTYYVTVRAYSAYSGVSLVADYATGGTPPPSGNFDIQFVFGPNVTASQRQLFQDAAARWEEVIQGDLPNAPLNKSANLCGQNEPAFNGTVDDVVIYAEVGPRDGPGGVLASAGPCLLRSGGLTTYGVMNFDSADSSGPDLFETILHEMGHVLGIGTLWSNFGLVNYTNSSCPANPRYSGSNARQEWLALGGSGDIPVEQDGGSGTRCGHWDENTFNQELMTGYSEGAAAEPLSRMTIGSLQDMGYGVNKNAADAYSLPSCSPNCSLELTPQRVDYGTREILLQPVGVVTPDGTVQEYKPDR